MVTIQLDNNTARILERQAQEAGMTLVEFLRALAGETPRHSRPSWDQLEQAIVALSSSGPTLPNNFCRADMYGIHD